VVGQVDEGKAHGLRETHQQIHIAGGRWLIASEGSKQKCRSATASM
jgi:hypothetical protein